MAKNVDNSQKVKLIAALAMLVVAGGVYFLMTRNSVDRPKGTVMQVFGDGKGTEAPQAANTTMTSTDEGNAEPEFDPYEVNPPAGSHMGNPDFTPPPEDEPNPEDPQPEPPPGF